MLKALLDSGAGASLIMSKHCNTLKTAIKKASFNTVAANFHTKGVVKAAFQLTELNPTAKIDHKLHVVDSLGLHDMILGRDFLSSLGLILDHSTETSVWGDSSIPMKATSAQVSEIFHVEDLKGINNIVGRIAGD
eukprot:3278901-Ditylum_brightwellii.AAC.1